MSGAGDGIVNIAYSIDGVNFDTDADSAIVTGAATGSHTFNITHYKAPFIKVIYTENSNTSISLTAHSAVELFGVGD